MGLSSYADGADFYLDVSVRNSQQKTGSRVIGRPCDNRKHSFLKERSQPFWMEPRHAVLGEGAIPQKLFPFALARARDGIVHDKFMPAEEALQMAEGRNRRLRSFWAPFYDPNDHEPFPEIEEDNYRSGFVHATIGPKALGSKSKIAQARFEKCDFLGPFSGQTRIFEHCIFDKCDFGLSTWRYAKFTNCTFIRSSFTQATFASCEFRDCTWSEMGLSGNETEFQSSTVSNPKDFVCSAYTNLDPQILASKSVEVNYQAMRLERTKANVARNLLNSLSQSGEERWYYEAVEIYNIQSFRASRIFYYYKARLANNLFLKAIYCLLAVGFRLEQIIIQFLGFFNKWGASLLRPAVLGIVILLLFAVVYRHWSFAKSWPEALLTSTDISLIAGYTKHAVSNDPFATQFLYLVNMLFGVFWFAIVVPTLINRISRVR